MRGRNVVVSFVVVALVVGATPATALAQGASDPQPVLLDRDTNHVADITVDGQQYSVYRHQNVFPWASGISIYTDGGRVTSESTAERVLTALAQRRAVQNIGAEVITQLRATSQNASAVANNVSAAATAVDQTLAYVNRTTTVRENASAGAAPRIPEFTETARELLPELRSFENDSAAYRSNATALVELLQQQERGTDVDPQRLYAQYEATLEAKDALSDHLGFGGIDEELTQLASTSGIIATNVSSVPQRGNKTARQFRRVDDESPVAANQTAAFELSEFDLGEFEERAASLEEDWTDEWNSRQSPASTVYQSIAAILIVIAVTGGYVAWRRR